jgi:predicted RNA-binding Zn ribbon-like protein
VERSMRQDFLWIGGVTCLDFSNTRSFRPTDDPLERLTSCERLVEWAVRAEVLAGEEKRAADREIARHPRIAKEQLEAAMDLRETIYRIFSARASGAAPEQRDLDAFNGSVAAAYAHRRVVLSANGFVWRWEPGDYTLRRLLWPIVVSAAELLVSDQLIRVRECALPTCSALFLDSSKNRSRRWCDMQDCGNRAKARAHYARKRLRSTS